MPGCPLHNACVRPAWLTGRPRSTSTTRRPESRPGSCGGVHPSDLFELDLWEQSLLARRPDSRPALAGVPSPIVGAGLLAKAAVHSALMQADPPLSRASPLPQGSAMDAHLINDQKPVWERACSRWRPDSRPGLWEWTDKLPDSSRFFRRALAVAGWEGLSLTFSRR